MNVFTGYAKNVGPDYPLSRSFSGLCLRQATLKDEVTFSPPVKSRPVIAHCKSSKFSKLRVVL